MWKAVIVLGCSFGVVLNTPIGLKNMPIVAEDEPLLTTIKQRSEIAMSTLNLPSNATSIRADITDSFSCYNKTYGYYADVENECQIFHVCLPVVYADGRENTFRWSFICPEETLFSQEAFTCVRSEDMNFGCDESERFYELNRNFGLSPDTSMEMNSMELAMDEDYIKSEFGLHSGSTIATKSQQQSETADNHNYGGDVVVSSSSLSSSLPSSSSSSSSLPSSSSLSSSVSASASASASLLHKEATEKKENNQKTKPSSSIILNRRKVPLKNLNRPNSINSIASNTNRPVTKTPITTTTTTPPPSSTTTRRTIIRTSTGMYKRPTRPHIVIGMKDTPKKENPILNNRNKENSGSIGTKISEEFHNKKNDDLPSTTEKQFVMPSIPIKTETENTNIQNLENQVPLKKDEIVENKVKDETPPNDEVDLLKASENVIKSEVPNDEQLNNSKKEEIEMELSSGGKVEITPGNMKNVNEEESNKKTEEIKIKTEETKTKTEEINIKPEETKTEIEEINTKPEETKTKTEELTPNKEDPEKEKETMESNKDELQQNKDNVEINPEEEEIHLEEYDQNNKINLGNEEVSLVNKIVSVPELQPEITQPQEASLHDKKPEESLTNLDGANEADNENLNLQQQEAFIIQTIADLVNNAAGFGEIKEYPQNKDNLLDKENSNYETPAENDQKTDTKNEDEEPLKGEEPKIPEENLSNPELSNDKILEIAEENLSQKVENDANTEKSVEISKKPLENDSENLEKETLTENLNTVQMQEIPEALSEANLEKILANLQAEPIKEEILVESSPKPLNSEVTLPELDNFKKEAEINNNENPQEPQKSPEIDITNEEPLPLKSNLSITELNAPKDEIQMIPVIILNTEESQPTVGQSLALKEETPVEENVKESNKDDEVIRPIYHRITEFHSNLLKPHVISADIEEEPTIYDISSSEQVLKNIKTIEDNSPVIETHSKPENPIEVSSKNSQKSIYAKIPIDFLDQTNASTDSSNIITPGKGDSSEPLESTISLFNISSSSEENTGKDKKNAKAITSQLNRTEINRRLQQAMDRRKRRFLFRADAS